MRRLPIVGVMGSGRERHEALAIPLGRWLAERGAHLLTGGGGGVMEAVSEAFVAVSPRPGLCIGVLPGPAPPEGYPNASVELPIRTHLPLSGARGTDPMSRNHLNALTPACLVALPGGPGTESELALAARYGTPSRRLDDPRALMACFEWIDDRLR